MDIDEVYEKIGEFGPRQKIYFLLLGLLGLYGPFHQLQMVFVGGDPGFSCTPKNASISNYPHDTCPGNRAEACSNISYVDSYTSTVTTWNLVCDRAYLSKTAQSVYMFGTMVVGLPGGRLSDKYGRKRVVVICILLTVVCSGMQAFLEDYRAYLVSKFFQGCFYAGTIPNFVLQMELLGSSKRGFVGTIGGLWFSLGIMLYAALAYYVRDWRELVVIINVGGLLVTAALMFLPESPRWLLLHGKKDEAKAVWASIAKGNGTHFDEDWDIVGQSNDVSSSKTGETHATSVLLKNSKLRGITMIQILSWFTNSVVYYGLTLAAGDFNKSLYTSVALSGLIEIPGTLLLSVVFLCMGRRAALAIFMISSGAACIVIMFLPANNVGEEIKFILGLVGKLGISASFSVVYIHSTEIYPTSIRTAALGFFFMSSRIGSMVAPFVGLVDLLVHDLQFFIYGFLGILAGVLNLFLPETSGRSMPQTMDELVARISGAHVEVGRKSRRLIALTRNGLVGLGGRGDNVDGEEHVTMISAIDGEEDDSEEEGRAFNSVPL